MTNRLYSTLTAALVLVVSAVPAFAQPAMKPIVVASITDYAGLMEDIGFVGKLAEMPDLAQSVEGLIGFVTQFQGLVGLDKSKPLGVSVSTDGGQFQIIGFVPVTDMGKLLGALGGVVGEAKDAGDGCKMITVNRLPLLIKEQNGWAFISYTKDAFTSLPKDPSEQLGDLDEEYDLGIRVFMQNVPPAFRDIGLQQLRQGMQQGLQRMPNETDEQFEARRKLTEQQVEALANALNELNEITIGFAIDSVERTTYLDMGVSVIPGGKLAKQLAGIENLKSQHTGFLLEESIADMHIASFMSADDITQMLTVIDAARKQAMGELEKNFKGDEADRAKVSGWAREFFDVAVDTIKTGTFSGGATLVGEGPITLVAGGSVVGAARLEQVLKDVVAFAKSKPDFEKANVEIKFDAQTHKGVRFHTISLPVPEGPDADKAKEFLGDDIVLTFGYSKDAWYFALGEDGIDTLVDVIDGSAKGDDDVLPFELTVALGPIMKLAAAGEPGNEDLQVMSKALQAGKDHISLSTEADGLSQFARIEIEEGVIRAFGLTAKAAAAKKQGR